MILIVGADSEDAGLLETLLEGHFPLAVASSRNEALALAKERPVDVAVMNLEEPFTGTYDTIQGLLDFREQTSILLLVDPKKLAAIAPLVESGLASYLERPFSPEDLRLRLTRLHPAQAEEMPKPIAPPGEPINEVTESSERHARPEIDPVSMDRLIMDLAHRVKNPLVSIRTFAHLLKERFNDAHFQKHFYQTMRQEVERIDAIIDQLIEFSELPEPSLDTYPLSPLLQEAVKRAFYELKGPKIRLNDGLWERINVEVDPEQFVYALVHLLIGLAGPTPRSESITISVDLLPEIQTEGLEILFRREVRKPQDRGRLFGLELFIAKRIIERQHGQVDWDITPDGQASMRVHLPLSHMTNQPSRVTAMDLSRQPFRGYADRRRLNLSISFKDRREGERRLARRSPHFPERRHIVPTSIQP